MSDICRFGVISDTHIGNLKQASELARQLLDGPFAEVEAILHAGDMVVPELEFCFGALPVYCVRGNMDRGGFEHQPLKRIVEARGFRIGLIHGWGAPDAVPAHAANEFADESVDIIVFGHSHVPLLREHCGVLLFNPGSATDNRDRAEFCTVGILELGSELRAHHVPFEFRPV